MSSQHTFSTEWDAPFSRVEIEFTYAPGVPEQSPSHASGGEPAEPANVEVGRVFLTVAGRRHEAPEWLADAFGGLFADDFHTIGEEYEGDVRAARIGRRQAA